MRNLSSIPPLIQRETHAKAILWLALLTSYPPLRKEPRNLHQLNPEYRALFLNIASLASAFLGASGNPVKEALTGRVKLHLASLIRFGPERHKGLERGVLGGEGIPKGIPTAENLERQSSDESLQ